MNSNLLRMLPLLIMLLISAAVALGLFNTKQPMDGFNAQNVGKVLENFEIPSLQKAETFTPKLFGNGKGNGAKYICVMVCAVCGGTCIADEACAACEYLWHCVER